MKIPDVIARLRDLAEELQEEHPDISVEIRDLAEELKRRPSGPRAAATSTQMTPELAEEIREFAEANPDLSNHVIASKFNVNPGRVSEAKKGKRT